MRENRDIYRAINSPGQSTSNDYVTEAAEPVAEPEAGVSEAELDSGKAVHSAKIGPDPRREAAKAVARERGANWRVRASA